MSDSPALRLADLLTRENAALAALDFPAAAALLAEKTAALAALQAAPPGTMAPGNLARTLPALVADNRALLERAILVQHRVIGIIARAAPRAASGAVVRYGRDGARAWGRQQPAVAMSARV
jgi:hypothetical protein